jgi:hypothetical protein
MFQAYLCQPMTASARGERLGLKHEQKARVWRSIRVFKVCRIEAQHPRFFIEAGAARTD